MILKTNFVLTSSVYIKVKSLYQHWKDNRISTSKQHRFINVKSKLQSNVEVILILGRHYKSFAFMLWSSRGCNLYINVKRICISFLKHYHLINSKATPKCNIEGTMILGWHWNQFCCYVIPTDPTCQINVEIMSTSQYQRISTSFRRVLLM